MLIPCREAKTDAKSPLYQEQLPPPPLPVEASSSSHSFIETRRIVETDAAVALMHEQLKAMGILNKTSIRIRRRGSGGNDSKLSADDFEEPTVVQDDSDTVSESEEEKEVEAHGHKAAEVSAFGAAAEKHESDKAPSSRSSWIGVRRSVEDIDRELLERTEDVRQVTR